MSLTAQNGHEMAREFRNWCITLKLPKAQPGRDTKSMKQASQPVSSQPNVISVAKGEKKYISILPFKRALEWIRRTWRTEWILTAEEELFCRSILSRIRLESFRRNGGQEVLEEVVLTNSFFVPFDSSERPKRWWYGSLNKSSPLV